MIAKLPLSAYRNLSTGTPAVSLTGENPTLKEVSTQQADRQSTNLRGRTCDCQETAHITDLDLE